MYLKKRPCGICLGSNVLPVDTILNTIATLKSCGIIICRMHSIRVGQKTIRISTTLDNTT